VATLKTVRSRAGRMPANRGRRRRLSPSSVSEPIRNYSITGYFSIMLIEYSAIVNGLSRNIRRFGRWGRAFSRFTGCESCESPAS